MATNGVTNNSVANSLFGAQQSAASTTKVASEDIQTRFMTLLMAQLKNQDPLNPTDANQMTAQLSQISTASGIEKLNATMEALLASYTGAQNMQAAAIIGKTILTAGNGMVLGENGGLGGVDLEADAERVTVTIKDAKGHTVQTMELGSMPAGFNSFVWDGMNAQGEALAPGNYRFSVSASAGGKDIKANTLESGTVNAVTMAKDGVLLELPNNKSVAYSDIVQILG